MRFFYRKQRTYTIMHMKNTKKKTLTGLLICIFLIAALFLGGKLLFYHVSDAENIWYFSGDTAQRIENIQMRHMNLEGILQSAGMAWCMAAARRGSWAPRPEVCGMAAERLSE